jgi:hypothetical protein
MEVVPESRLSEITWTIASGALAVVSLPLLWYAVATGWLDWLIIPVKLMVLAISLGGLILLAALAGRR